MPVLKRSHLSYRKQSDDASDTCCSENEKDFTFAVPSTDISSVETQSDIDNEKTACESEVQPEEELHCFLSNYEKVFIIAQMGFVSLSVYLSFHSVYPAFTAIKKEFNVGKNSGSHVFVVYFIAMAVGTIFFSGAADAYGRRPTLLVLYFFYMLSNVALALAPNYIIFLVFRCLQALFMAAPPYIAVGVVTDLTGVSNRATYISMYLAIYLTGSIIGPPLGSEICESFGWRAVFIFISLLSFALFLVYAIALPETSKSIVGPRGTLLPQKWTWISVAPILKFRYYSKRLEKNENSQTGEKVFLPKAKRYNPFSPLKLLWSRPTQSVLMCTSISISIAVNLAVDLHSVFKKTYHLSNSQTALAFLPGGIATWLSSFCLGFIAKWSYNYYSRRAEVQGKPLNLLRARLLVIFVPLVLLILGCFIYGWTVQLKWNLAILLVSAFTINLSTYIIIGASSTILVDLYPEQSAGAVSLGGFQPDLFIALFVALHGYLENLGSGIEYTILGGLAILASCGIIYSYFYD